MLRRSCPITGLASRLGLAVLLLVSPAVSGDAGIGSGANGTTTLGTEALGDGHAALAQLQQEVAADRDRLHQALAAVQARLTAIEQQGGFAGLIAAQTEVIADLARRLEASAPGAGSGAGADAATGSRVVGPGQGTVGAPAGRALADEVAHLRAQLATTEQRLRLLIEQFASAQALREQATTQATEARAQLAEMNARQQQARLELQEAQLRADKAEKSYAALEQVRERGVTERERLHAELEATRERLAESLKHTLALDTRLANAEARVAQLTTGQRVSPTPAPGDNTTAQPAEPVATPPTATGTVIQTAPEAEDRGAVGAEPPAVGMGGGMAGGTATDGVLPTADVPPGAGVNGPEAPASPASRPGSPSPSVATAPPSATVPTGNNRRPAVYAVRADDSLSKISAKVYGNAAEWQRIYEANRDVLNTPDQLAPGMMLVIP